jgi:hypothetical protein
MGFLLMSGAAFAQEDAKGCKDHPLFSRMEGYRIVTCQEKEFDAEDFIDPATKRKVTIEGRKFRTEYITNKPFEGKYSRLQVSRNFLHKLLTLSLERGPGLRSTVNSNQWSVDGRSTR